MRFAPGTWRDYLALTKPRINSLLLYTTLAAMVLAAEETPAIPILIWTMLGGCLAAGGAGALNSALDADLDARMGYTRGRPVADGRLEPGQALRFGIILSVISLLVLALGTNLLAAGLALLGIVYYVGIYTIWLKRRTTENIVVGGLAGALPPLVGWAAVRGSLAIEPLILALIIFYWTPPHTWSLALFRKRDYARAGVPMLPVVQGPQAANLRILFYAILTAAVSIIPAALGYSGVLYLGSALALGGLLIFRAADLHQNPSNAKAYALYRYSNFYLTLLFTALIVDKLVM
jgi:heme o synthase